MLSELAAARRIFRMLLHCDAQRRPVHVHSVLSADSADPHNPVAAADMTAAESMMTGAVPVPINDPLAIAAPTIMATETNAAARQA